MGWGRRLSHWRGFRGDGGGGDLGGDGGRRGLSDGRATGVEKDFWRFNVLVLGSASQNAV